MSLGSPGSAVVEARVELLVVLARGRAARRELMSSRDLPSGQQPLDVAIGRQAVALVAQRAEQRLQQSLPMARELGAAAVSVTARTRLSRRVVSTEPSLARGGGR